MPATLLALDGQAVDNPRPHQKGLKNAFLDAISNVVRGDPEFRVQQHRALWSYPEFLERRLRLLERGLRRVLASDTVDDQTRHDALALLHGATGIGRNPGLLTEHEKQLVDAYRSFDAKTRTAIRVIVEGIERR